MSERDYQNSIGRRFRRARGWLVLFLLAAVATAVIGRSWLFADADCPNLQDVLLYGSVFVAWALMSFMAVFSRGDAPVNQIQRIAAIFVIGLIGPVIIGFMLFQLPELRSQFCPTCEKYIETAEDLRRTAEKDANPLAKIDGAELYGRRAMKTCGPNTRTAAADMLAHVLFDKAGLLLKNYRDCTLAKSSLQEAAELGREHDLDSNFIKAIAERETNRAYLCEPTPTPTRTPLPTATNTPLPTRTPLPPLAVKQNKPCTPNTTDDPAKVVTLTQPISSGVAKNTAVGVFYREEFAVDYQFRENEVVCLASTRDGRGPLSVDDRMEFFVLQDNDIVGQWGHDFYDPKSAGIESGFRPEDVSELFDVGRYRVRLVLTDLHPQYYSSTAVYLVIWETR